jgi:hypothetical protein
VAFRLLKTVPGSAGVPPANSVFGSQLAGETPALPGSSWNGRFEMSIGFEKALAAAEESGSWNPA